MDASRNRMLPFKVVTKFFGGFVWGFFSAVQRGFFFHHCWLIIMSGEVRSKKKPALLSVMVLNEIINNFKTNKFVAFAYLIFV
jgi:hypothetical protein